MHRGACAYINFIHRIPILIVWSSGIPNPLQNHFPRAYTMPQRRTALQTYYFVSTLPEPTQSPLRFSLPRKCSYLNTYPNPIGCALPHSRLVNGTPTCNGRPLYACSLAAYLCVSSHTHRLQMLLRIFSPICFQQLLSLIAGGNTFSVPKRSLPATVAHLRQVSATARQSKQCIIALQVSQSRLEIRQTSHD